MVLFRMGDLVKSHATTSSISIKLYKLLFIGLTFFPLTGKLYYAKINLSSELYKYRRINYNYAGDKRIRSVERYQSDSIPFIYRLKSAIIIRLNGIRGIMKNELIKLKTACRYPAIFIKWAAISGVIGLAGGAVGSIFHISVDEATSFREENPWLIWFLPLGGLVNRRALHRVCKMQGGYRTDRIISSVRCDEKVPALIAPLIFIGTVITHLFGGSAGREGAALQLGGSLGYQTGKFLRLDDKDMHLITLCGMSAVFSALFGTPLTAAVFALEVISVGVIYYSGLVPCLFSSLVAYALSLLFKIKPVRFKLAAVPELSVLLFAKLVALAILCAVVSVVFCVALHKTNQLSRKYIKNDYMGSPPAAYWSPRWRFCWEPRITTARG